MKLFVFFVLIVAVGARRLILTNDLSEEVTPHPDQKDYELVVVIEYDWTLEWMDLKTLNNMAPEDVRGHTQFKVPLKTVEKERPVPT